jgi:hypothetical protein
MGAAQAGGLFLGLAVVLACRMLRVRPGVPLVVLLALLLTTGLLSTSQVPGVAQLADAKTRLEHWRERQIEINHAVHEQLMAAENGDPAPLDPNCPAGTS